MEVTRLRLTPYNNGLMLKGIFLFQTNLMMNLLVANKLKAAEPLNLTIRENQDLIRGLIGYIIEELAEGETTYSKWMHRFRNERSRIAALPWAEREEFEKGLIGFREEIIDAIHFIVELFIFSDITDEDIGEYMNRLLAELGLNDLSVKDPLVSSLNYISHALLTQEEEYFIPGIEVKAFSHYNKGSLPGNLFSFERYDQQRITLWRFVHQLYKAQNFLKLKPWRNHGPELNLEMYKATLMEAWLIFCRYLYIVDFTYVPVIYSTYAEKNEANLQRIEKNY